MRALGRHIVEQRANRTSRHQDLEANKARSAVNRGQRSLRHIAP
jgi:hypothetical protein